MLEEKNKITDEGAWVDVDGKEEEIHLPGWKEYDCIMRKISKSFGNYALEVYALQSEVTKKRKIYNDNQTKKNSKSKIKVPEPVKLCWVRHNDTFLQESRSRSPSVSSPIPKLIPTPTPTLSVPDPPVHAQASTNQFVPPSIPSPPHVQYSQVILDVPPLMYVTSLPPSSDMHCDDDVSDSLLLFGEYLEPHDHPASFLTSTNATLVYLSLKQQRSGV